MSDREVPQPDETPADVNEVVESANESLAEAEAVALAPETAVDPDMAAFEEAERSYPGTFVSPPASDGDEVVVEEAVEATTIEAPAPDASPQTVVAEEVTVVAEESAPAEASAPVAPIADDAYAPTAYDEPASVAPAEPVYSAEPTYAAAPVAPAPQPIFVQAPEPPRERGNRAAAGGIGVLAAIAFGILYLAVRLVANLIEGSMTLAEIGTDALRELQLWEFWVPVVVFFLGFWLLGAIVNRARWAYWVIFGLVVGVLAWGGHILGQLFQAPFWNITQSEGLALFEEQAFAPLAIASFIIGRELTIWFGAWAARSGARKTELNAIAQREYERTLEAGPTLAAR